MADEPFWPIKDDFGGDLARLNSRSVIASYAASCAGLTHSDHTSFPEEAAWYEERVRRGPANISDDEVDSLVQDLPFAPEDCFVLFYPCFLKRYSGHVEGYYLWDLAFFLRSASALPPNKTERIAFWAPEADRVLRKVNKVIRTRLPELCDGEDWTVEEIDALAWPWKIPQTLVFVFGPDRPVQVVNGLKEVRKRCEDLDVYNGVYEFFDTACRPLRPDFREAPQRGCFSFSTRVQQSPYRLVPEPQREDERLLELLHQATKMRRNPWFHDRDAMEDVVKNRSRSEGGWWDEPPVIEILP